MPITGTNGPDLITGTNGNDDLVGLAGDDTLRGLDGNDTLDGGNDNDILTGGLGTDILTGGAGSNIFLDNAAGLNGDRITDFLPGDRIQFTDLTVANANFNLIGSTLTFNGGSLQLDNVGPGRLVIRPINNGGVEIRLQSAAQNDFNGDGRSDVLWRNDNGALTDWLSTTSGGFTANSNASTVVDIQWQVAATGDFNGDGRVDLLWHRADGALTNWLGTTQGTFAPNGGSLLEVVNPQWQVAGVGDFNGDGREDVLWHRADGALTNWLGTASGGLTPNGNNLLEVVNTQWQVAGVADFNGDGVDDVLWHRADGAVTNWLGTESGGLTPNGGNFLEVVDPQWKIAGVGDFNGDGRGDILWYRNDGAVTNWLGTASGNLTPNAANFLTVVDTQWHVAAVGDYNGDAIDDILWRNSDGRVTNWLGNSTGSFIDNASNALTPMGTPWHVQPDAFLS